MHSYANFLIYIIIKRTFINVELFNHVYLFLELFQRKQPLPNIHSENIFDKARKTVQKSLSSLNQIRKKSVGSISIKSQGKPLGFLIVLLKRQESPL